MGEVSLGRLQGFPIVKGLKPGEVLLVPLYKIGHLVQQAAPLRGVHGPPNGSELKGTTSRIDCQVHISFSSLRNLAYWLLCGRVNRGEGGSTHRVDKLVVDEQLGELHLRRGHGDSGIRTGDGGGRGGSSRDRN